MPESYRGETWFSFGLAFVGGYCDAAGYVLAQTFTGHITGALVLAAINLAGENWPGLVRNVLAIAFFLTGVALSLMPKQFLAGAPSRLLLPAVMGVEIGLIAAAYFAVTSHLIFKVGLFVGCMSLAMGLQNGAFTQTGGISVHTTYLTGLITSLVKTEVEERRSSTTSGNAPTSNLKARLLAGIWLAFVAGASVGAAMIFRFGSRGLIGAVVLLGAMVAGLFASRETLQSRASVN